METSTTVTTGPPRCRSALVSIGAAINATTNESRQRDCHGPRAGGLFRGGHRTIEVPAMALSPVATMTIRPSVPWSPLVVADGRCKGCELCVGACPEAVLGLDRTRVNALGYHPVKLLHPDDCTSCAICARVCPDAVFTVWARPRRKRDR